MTLGQLVESTALEDGRTVGWNEFWNHHANSSEWATHAQIIAASSYYRRPVVVVTSVGPESIVGPGADPTAAPLYVMLSMASVVVPGRTERVAAHHYEGLFVVEVSHYEGRRFAVDGKSANGL